LNETCGTVVVLTTRSVLTAEWASH